jgi:Holliday junction resolvase RusA-like endonuclease
VSLDLLFEIRRPLGHYRGRKPGAGLTPAAIAAYPRRPDLDKLIRSTIDAVALGGLIGDDAQVIEVRARKVYSSAQGVRVKVESLFP